MTPARLVAAAAIVLALVATARATSTPDSGDVRPPLRLEATGLYEAGQIGRVGARNRPFAPQYPLWSDGAVKRRWVHLPEGTAIDGRDPFDWDVPVGTRFWKEFRFGDRPVETRYFWKAAPDRWVAASYEWNAEGTAAVLAPDSGRPGVASLAAGRSHGIPSAQDCQACHGSTRTRPLGFNALQLSPDRDPNAIHGEAFAPGMVTLKTLADEGRARHERVALESRSDVPG